MASAEIEFHCFVRGLAWATTTKRSKGPSLLLARSLNLWSFCCRDWIKSDSDLAPSVLSVWSVFLCYLICDTLLLYVTMILVFFFISESHLSLIHISGFYQFDIVNLIWVSGFQIDDDASARVSNIKYTSCLSLSLSLSLRLIILETQVSYN
jgi:hypothetical protein